MHIQLIVVFVSGFLALLGIRILISSFDNDGDGMAYSTRESYQFSILEGSWNLTISCEFFSSVAHWCHAELCVLWAIVIIASLFFSQVFDCNSGSLLGHSFFTCQILKDVQAEPDRIFVSLTNQLTWF